MICLRCRVNQISNPGVEGYSGSRCSMFSPKIKAISKCGGSGFITNGVGSVGGVGGVAWRMVVAAAAVGRASMAGRAGRVGRVGGADKVDMADSRETTFARVSACQSAFLLLPASHVAHHEGVVPAFASRAAKTMPGRSLAVFLPVLLCVELKLKKQLHTHVLL